MALVIQICRQLASRIRTDGSCSKAVNKRIWHKPLLCVQWKIPDDGQKYSLKHAEFHSKNKIEILVHLIGIIIKILHDAHLCEPKEGRLSCCTSCCVPEFSSFSKLYHRLHNLTCTLSCVDGYIIMYKPFCAYVDRKGRFLNNFRPI